MVGEGDGRGCRVRVARAANGRRGGWTHARLRAAIWRTVAGSGRRPCGDAGQLHSPRSGVGSVFGMAAGSQGRGRSTLRSGRRSASAYRSNRNGKLGGSFRLGGRRSCSRVSGFRPASTYSWKGHSMLSRRSVSGHIFRADHTLSRIRQTSGGQTTEPSPSPPRSIAINVSRRPRRTHLRTAQRCPFRGARKHRPDVILVGCASVFHSTLSEGRRPVDVLAEWCCESRVSNAGVARRTFRPTEPSRALCRGDRSRPLRRDACWACGSPGRASPS